MNKHGKVYLIRLPLHPDIMKIENEFMPDFNRKMIALDSITEGYYDMTPFNSNYKYVDGNHLYKDSGKDVTFKIANWIKNVQLAKNK